MDDRAQRSRRQAWQLAATGSAPGSNLRPTATASAASAASTAASSRRSSSFYVSSAMTLAASQNLPAVLNDPNKGKQRDFFTRSWGDSFSETRPVPPSGAVCDLPPNSFDRYLKKVRKHRRLHSQMSRIQEEASAPSGSPSKVDANSNKASVSTAGVSRIFLDPSFDLSKPETFEAIFQLSATAAGENFAEQVERSGRMIQERLSQQLDAVEVSITEQIAQKSHNFFQVMTYHDALMTQLQKLVEIVQVLRSKLKTVDQDSLRPSLKLCHLKRRLENLEKCHEKLSLMSTLHETQPTIQQLLTSSDFSGALDLITTSCEILSVHLNGVNAFRHLVSQLKEIQGIIGKMLLADFETFITAEIGRETVHVKATTLCSSDKRWDDFDAEQLKSVIFGLLRQNSFTFLEALEDASTSAIKSTLREVAVNVTKVPEVPTTITNLVGDFARSASTEEWIDLFDVLIGSLVVLLHRIHTVHRVIGAAIDEVNVSNGSGEDKNSSNTEIHQSQLDALKSTNREVLINVCEQMHERTAKLLTQRSKASNCKAQQITTQELTNLGLLVSIFGEETQTLAGRQCSGLQLSLQSQTVIFVQSFHEENRTRLSTILERETWKKARLDNSAAYAKLGAIPSLQALFSKQNENNGEDGSEKSASAAEDTDSEKGSSKDEAANSIGHFLVSGESYSVTESIPTFLKMLADYCNLCTMLPDISVELGLKAAELIKFLNSRICQLVLGAGAISVSGLKTITIRNLALALRSLQLVVNVIPHVLIHFQKCHSERNLNLASPQMNGTKSDAKQLEVLQRQFEQAVKHLKNHCDELNQKILTVVTSIIVQQLTTWRPPAAGEKLPSASFKALCKQLNKLNDSTKDVFTDEQRRLLFSRVHDRFLQHLRKELVAGRGYAGDAASAQSRALLSELVFYGQSLMRLDVIQSNRLERPTFEALWNDDS